MTAGSRRVRARFDEQALAEDLARLSDAGREACSRARERFEREACRSTVCVHARRSTRAGTSLPGCLKVYVPGWDGPWRIVFQIATDERGALLSFLAAGVGHHPRGARAPNAYQIAHHRLHGRWPRRAS